MFLERNGLEKLDIRDQMEENPVWTVLHLGAKGDSDVWILAHKIVIIPSEFKEGYHILKAFSGKMMEDGTPEVVLNLHLVGLRMGKVLLGASYYYAHLKPIEHEHSLEGIKIPGVDLEEIYPKIAGQRLEIAIRFPM